MALTVYKVDGVKRIEITDSGYPFMPLPQNFNVSSGTYVTKIKLTWDEPELPSGYESGADIVDHYEIWRSEEEEKFYEKIAETTLLYYDDKDAQAGKYYWYKIKAKTIETDDFSELSEFSDSVRGYRQLSAPRRLSATYQEIKDLITITWARSDGAEKYKLYRQNGGTPDPPFETFTVETGENQYSLETSDEDVYFEIEAISENGDIVSARSPYVTGRIKT